MGSWKGRGNQYLQFVRVLYCKLPTNGKHLPAFPLEAVPGIEPRPQRWEVRVLPLCHRGPRLIYDNLETWDNTGVIVATPACEAITLKILKRDMNQDLCQHTDKFGNLVQIKSVVE